MSTGPTTEGRETASPVEQLVRLLRALLSTRQTLLAVFVPKNVTGNDNVGTLCAIVGDPMADGGVIVMSYIARTHTWESNCGDRHAVRFLADALIAIKSAETMVEVRERFDEAINWGGAV